MVERVLVTGGSRNIGRGICERLVADGYEVVQFDVLAPENPEAGRHVAVDLADRAATAAALDALLAEGCESACKTDPLWWVMSGKN